MCLIMAALPLQAAIAATMLPAALAPATGSMPMSMSMPAHEHDANAPCHDATTAKHLAHHHAPTCSDCAACCAFAAPPPAGLPALAALPTSALALAVAPFLATFVTDGPLRPPRLVR